MQTWRRGWVTTVRAVVTVFSLGVLTAAAADGPWLTDLDAAKARAATEKKDILVDFSGSDWCGWCIKLDQEVFSQAAFREAAGKDFVFVVLDFPRKPENQAKQSDAEKARNKELSEKLGVQGFPTVILMDAAGVPYARTGYQAGGVDAYLKHLAELRAMRAKRADLTAKLAAPGLAGPDKAKLLDQLIDASDPALDADGVTRNMTEVVALDADNALGLKAKYQVSLKLNEALAQIEKDDADGALVTFQAILSDLKPTGETLQGVLFEMGRVYFVKKDMPSLRTCLKNALDAAPQGARAESLKKMIERFAPKPGEAAAPAAVPAPAPAAKP